MNALQAWWAVRSAREKQWLTWSGVSFSVILIGWWGVWPALQLWQQGDAAQRKRDTEMGQMLSLARQAQTLQQQPSVNLAQAEQGLQALLKRLGHDVKVQTQGDRVSVVVQHISAAALAELLIQSRQEAMARVEEADLQWKNQGWEGRLVWVLPEPR